MANGTTTRSTANGRTISHQYDQLQTLDVLDDYEFKEGSINQAEAESTEMNFYKGAPAQWLNFYLSEKGAALEKQPQDVASSYS
ncbi:hypothetical protein DPEC_G00096200, partial [Dallia pectoralis]